MESMILTELQKLENYTMVDGCFDPLHHGHIRYFQLARSLGAPLFCYVSGDHYLVNKHKPLLEGQKRILVIDAIKHIDKCFLGSTSTADALRIVQPKRYVKGIDWKERGLPDVEIDICREFNIQVEFVDASLDSSSSILNNYMER